MRRHSQRALIGFIISFGLCGIVSAVSTSGAPGAVDQELPPAAGPPAAMSVITAAHHARVQSLQDVIELHRGWHDPDGPLNESFPGQGAPGGGNPGGGGGGNGSGIDPVRQTIYPDSLLPLPLASFDGIGVNGGSPADPNLAVGTTQVVEIVNTMFQVFDKSGVSQSPAAKINTLFASLTGSPCSFAVSVRRMPS